MTDRCPVEWETFEGDEDGDGEAEHCCFLPDGHDGEYHWCADHFGCAPVWGSPAWFHQDPGTATGMS